MSTVKENIKISIDRLTHLLQLSLGQYSLENARMLTKTIVDLIDHTTMLSMETNDLIDKHKQRELELCSCLVDMDALVKKQRKKLQMVPTKAPTLDKGINTDDICCSTCKEHEETILKLQYNVNHLEERNGTLQGKLLQSKYLLQAQQILLAKKAPHDVFDHAGNNYNRNNYKLRDTENRKDSAGWKSNLCEEEQENVTRTQVPHHTVYLKEGLPPMRPNSRYREVAVEDFDEPSLEEEEERQEGKEEEGADGDNRGDYYSHHYGAEEEDDKEEEEVNEMDAPDGNRYYSAAPAAAALEYGNDDNGDRSLEYLHHEGSYEEQEHEVCSGSSGSNSSNSGEFVYGQGDEDENEEQYTEELNGAYDNNNDDEEEDAGDEYHASEHHQHQYRYHQESQRYGTSSKASLGKHQAGQASSQESDQETGLGVGQEPGPGWGNHLADNVEDSFSLIQNFYDIGFT